MERFLVVTGALLGALAGSTMGFEPPTSGERLRAIGPTQALPESLRRALEPGDDFEPVPRPQPQDWLAVHPEGGQSFDDFVRSEPNHPDAIRGKIYLLPLGPFPKDQSPSLEMLNECARAYFAMPVETLSPIDVKNANLTARTNPLTGNRQLLTGDILATLKKRLPPDAFCLLGITMEDLYPEPSWNFVFGQASLRERVGVYSFARYAPAFYAGQRGSDDARILLRRSCKVLVHETAHMFGLQHCIFFKCVLNGSNHLAESDARPLHLCPVCLRKLQHSVGFAIADRYAALARFYRQVGFDDEARWVQKRLQQVRGEARSRPEGP